METLVSHSRWTRKLALETTELKRAFLGRARVEVSIVDRIIRDAKRAPMPTDEAAIPKPQSKAPSKPKTITSDTIPAPVISSDHLNLLVTIPGVGGSGDQDFKAPIEAEMIARLARAGAHGTAKIRELSGQLSSVTNWCDKCSRS